MQSKKFLRFAEQKFFLTKIKFNPHWYYQPNNQYVSGKNIDIKLTDKNLSKNDCFDRSILNVDRQPLVFSFNLDKPLGYILI